MISNRQYMLIRVLGLSIIGFIVFAGPIQAYTLKEKIFDQNVVLSEFTGDSVSFTAVLDTPALTIEYGTFSTNGINETLQSKTLANGFEGSYKIYQPIALQIPGTETLILVVYNSNPKKNHGETHIFRYEGEKITNHIVEGGDLNQSSRLYFIDNEVFIGYQNIDTYVIARYDLAKNQLIKLFDLKEILNTSRYTFMQDFISYQGKLYFSGGYLLEKEGGWQEQSFLFQLTPQADGNLLIKSMIIIADRHILSIMPRGEGVWLASFTDYRLTDGSRQREFFLNFMDYNWIFSLNYSKTEYNVFYIKILSDTDFVATFDHNRLCKLSITSEKLRESWCVSPTQGQITQLLTKDEQIVLVSTWDGKADIFIIGSEDPPVDFDRNQYSTRIVDDIPSGSLEIWFPYQMFFIAFALIIVIHRKNREQYQFIL